MRHFNLFIVSPDAFVFWGTTLLCALTLFF